MACFKSCDNKCDKFERCNEITCQTTATEMSRVGQTFSPELFTKRNHLSQTNISGKKNNLVSVMAGNSSFVIRKLWTEKTCLRKVGVKIGKTARKK